MTIKKRVTKAFEDHWARQIGDSDEWSTLERLAAKEAFEAGVKWQFNRTQGGQSQQAQRVTSNIEVLACLAENSDIDIEVTYDEGYGSPTRFDTDISEHVAKWIRAQSGHPPAPVAVPDIARAEMEFDYRLAIEASMSYIGDFCAGFPRVTEMLDALQECLDKHSAPTNKDHQQAALLRAHNGGED